MTKRRARLIQEKAAKRKAQQTLVRKELARVFFFILVSLFSIHTPNRRQFTLFFACRNSAIPQVTKVAVKRMIWMVPAF